MYSARIGNVIAARLELGEDVLPSLLAICQRHGARGGFAVSGIGMLADPELGFFAGAGQYVKRVFGGNHELLNLSGNFSLRDGALMPHLHAMLADEEFHVFGGHLFSAKVGMTLEVQISVVDEPVRMFRQVEASGLPGLYVE